MVVSGQKIAAKQTVQDLPSACRYAALALPGAAKLMAPRANTTPALMIMRLFFAMRVLLVRLWRISSIARNVRVDTTWSAAIRRRRMLALPAYPP
jgi:hypothetical protein